MRSDHDPWQTGLAAVDVLAVSHGTPSMPEDRRRQRLAALLAAAQASPVYRGRLAGRRDGGSLDGVAPIAKRELMQHFADWVTEPGLRLADLKAFVADPARIGEAFDGRFVVWESSGSSGEPGLFVQDSRAMAVYDALEGLRRPPLNPLRRWLDPWCLGERIAFVGATTGHFASTVSMQRLRRLQPGLAQRLRGVDFLQPLAEVVAQLHDHAPTVLATYPSAALLLAEEARAGRLRLSLAEIWTGGESLSAPMRAEIEARFGCPVANSYGASEFLAIAAPCRLGVLHLNADWVVLEPVDARGRAVPAGVCGATTWLTNLANHVQPLIRYDIGDRVTLHAQRCACGSPLPAMDVQGRADETLCLRDARARRVALLPLALVTVLEDAGVIDFQLVQTGEHSLQLNVGVGHAAADARRAKHALQEYLGRQGLAAVRLELCRGQVRRQGRSGKLRRVMAESRP
jgi:phenylacetate-coenzyme A ligase PaaK-like adenylate-forming protein